MAIAFYNSVCNLHNGDKLPDVKSGYAEFGEMNMRCKRRQQKKQRLVHENFYQIKESEHVNKFFTYRELFFEPGDLNLHR